MRELLKRDQFTAQTGRDGLFEIAGLPADVCFAVVVKRSGFGETSLHAATTNRPLTIHRFNQSGMTRRNNVDVEVPLPDSHEVRTGDLTIILHPVHTVLVDVVEADTGQPVANVEVGTNTDLGEGASSFGKTNRDGRVELKLPIGQYDLTADPPRGSLCVPTRSHLDGTAGRDKDPFTLRLTKGCVVNFEVVEGDSGKAIEGVAFFDENEQLRPKEPFLAQTIRNILAEHGTDKEGRARAVLPPGDYRFSETPQWVGTRDLTEEYQPERPAAPMRLASGETVEVKFQLKRKPTAAKASFEKACGSDPPDSKPAAGGESQAVNPAAKTADAEASLSGKLVDETGQPVTDALLQLMNTRTQKAVHAQSDENGNYQFAAVKEFGDYEIQIKSKRWVSITDHQQLPHVDLAAASKVVRDFTLPRACRLHVRVIDEQGHPIPKVFVDASLPGEMKNFGGRGTTDADGWAMLDAMKPSSQERVVTTRGDDYTAGQISVTLNDPAVVVERLMVLQKSSGIEVKGTAVCSDGKPPVGWRIHASSVKPHPATGAIGSPIGSDGSFAISQITPGIYDIVVDIPVNDDGVFTPTRVLSSVELPPDKPLVVKIDYPSPASMAAITGDIEIAGGTLQRGFHISARSSNFRYHGDAFVRPGQRDFKIGPLPRTSYTLSFDSTEIEQLELRDVPAPTEKLHVKLKVQPPLSFRGTVVRADNQMPVAHFRVQVSKLRTLRGRNYGQDAAWHEFNDAQGKFAVDLVGPGVYSALLMADGFAPTHSELFDTDRDRQCAIRIELKPGVALSGNVVDEQGQSVNGAKIVALMDDALLMSANRFIAPTTAGDEIGETRGGAFTIEHFNPALGRLKVVHPDFSPTIVEKVSVGPDGKTAPLTIVMHRGATVRGHVYDDFGKLEKDVAISFRNRSGDAAPYRDDPNRLASAVTDRDGYYEVQHLPDEFCYVQRGDPWRARGVVRQTIQTADGKVQTLDFGGTTKLTGRLIVNGAPLVNAKVQLSDESPIVGDFQAFGQTDSSGAFAFWGPPAGKHILYFATPEQSRTWVRARN